MRENGILFPMTVLPIQTTNSTTSPLTFPNRLGSKLWENMTWAMTSRHSTTFKIMGLVVLAGLLLLYCACRVYISMASREVNKSTPSLVPPLPQPITEALPDGIKQEQVDEIIEIFTQNYRNCSRPDSTPTQPVIYIGSLEKCREGRTAENPKTVQRLLSLARYLKNQKIITSLSDEEPYIDLRNVHYQFTLHEEFIKKLKTDLH